MSESAACSYLSMSESRTRVSSRKWRAWLGRVRGW